MSGIIFVDSTTVEATSGQMLVTFGSGGDNFRFHMPAHTAIHFRNAMLKDGWQIMCAPDADVVPLKPSRGKGGRP